MTRAEMLDTTEDILNRAGFLVSQRCVTRSSCFDFAARREELLTLVKVLVDIGNTSTKETMELRRISRFLSATPILIADKTRGRHLDDDTLYMRYGVGAVTPKTFGNMVFLKMYPLVEAGPGGYYVNLDGNVIRERRQELELSVGKLAELMAVSRRTIYGYEKEISKASVSAAYKLGWILGIPVARPTNPFQACPLGRGFLAAAKRAIRNRLLNTVLRKLSHLDFRVTHTKRAPFDFIAQNPEEGLSIIGGVPGRREQNLDRRTEEIMSVGRVTNARMVFVTDGRHVPNNAIPLIHREEWERIKSPEDLMARL